MVELLVCYFRELHRINPVNTVSVVKKIFNLIGLRRIKNRSILIDVDLN